MKFTIHFATINTTFFFDIFVLHSYLQYTLLLLIHGKKGKINSTYKKFTIHFATINTESKFTVFGRDSTFTIHFATINTELSDKYNAATATFTIHFATINTTKSPLSYFK